jgi:hypothetical protein
MSRRAREGLPGSATSSIPDDQLVSHMVDGLHIHEQRSPVRIIPVVMTLLFLASSPAVAVGQTFAVHGSGGPTLSDPGYSLAAGVGLSPMSHLTFLVDIERTHFPSRIETYEGGVTAAFRGGTFTLVAPALRVSVLGNDRVGPYGLVGLAGGVSRPNVTDLFPSRVSDEVVAPFFGGGFQVPLEKHLAFFAEARMMLAVGTDADAVYAIAPFRAGVAWRF